MLLVSDANTIVSAIKKARVMGVLVLACPTDPQNATSALLADAAAVLGAGGDGAG